MNDEVENSGSVATEESSIKYDFDPEKPPGEVIEKSGRVTGAVDNAGKSAAESIGIKGRYRSRLDSMKNGSIIITLQHEIRLAHEPFIEYGVAFEYIFGYIRAVQNVFKSVEILGLRELTELRDSMMNAAHQSAINVFQVYKPPALQDIADDLLAFQEPMSQLWPSESCSLTTQHGTIDFSKNVITSKENNLSILTNDVKTERSKENLLIRKPDLLGTSMWELKRNGRNIRAYMMDLEWLMQFQGEREIVQSGSGILVDLVEKKYIGVDGVVFKSDFYIEKVHEKTEPEEDPVDS